MALNRGGTDSMETDSREVLVQDFSRNWYSRLCLITNDKLHLPRPAFRPYYDLSGSSGNPDPSSHDTRLPRE